jgi:4-amino-4-deoxy-L-arabinose transferase-like glycosyltransferase
VLLSAWMMTRDHSWGDDFAAYIMQARSLAQGDMQEYVVKNTFTMERSSHVFGPVTEPWGFPLMLSPVYALLGLRVQALKAVVVLCYAAFLLAFFLLARTRFRDPESLLLTAVLAFNVGMLEGTNQVLSDIPFALWSTLSLWLIVTLPRAEAGLRARLWHSALLGLAVFAAIFTRIAGFLLFVPLISAQIMRLRSDRRTGAAPAEAARWIGIPYLIVGALSGLQALIFPSVSHVDPLGPVTLHSVVQNLAGYFWAPAYFLRNIIGGNSALYLALLPFFVFGVLRRWRGDLPLVLYILASLALFIFRAGMPEPRYLYPLWPLFVLFAFEGMQLAAARLPRALRPRALHLAWDAFLVLAALSLAACLQLGWLNLRAGRYDYRESRGVFHPTTNQMFEFIREQTPANSVVIFFKPRAMRLRTERDAFFTTRCEDLPDGDYVVIEKSMGGYDQILPAEVTHCNPAVSLTPVYEKDQFVVYQILSAQ